MNSEQLDLPPLATRRHLDQLLFAMERLGSFLLGRVGTLVDYKIPLSELALRSALARDVPDGYADWHSNFEGLYELVRVNRNDALHQGAFARHLAVHAAELCLVLEDGLMQGATAVRDFMVVNPVCARSWEPVSSIRRTMLLNSFSYLPVDLQEEDYHGWHLVSDLQVAGYLRENSAKRKERLATPLVAAIREGKLRPSRATEVAPAFEVGEIRWVCSQPMLVVAPDQRAHLLGILTPFDLL